MADNWIELPSLSQWPQPLVLKSIDQLSEIYFLQRVWKTVEVTYLQSVLNVEDETSGFHPCKAILEVSLKWFFYFAASKARRVNISSPIGDSQTFRMLRNSNQYNDK